MFSRKASSANSSSYLFVMTRTSSSCSVIYTSLSTVSDILPCQWYSPSHNQTMHENGSTGGFTCHCAPNYQGDSCTELSVDMCRPNPCQNDGRCEQLTDDYSCICQESFMVGVYMHGLSCLSQLSLLHSGRVQIVRLTWICVVQIHVSMVELAAAFLTWVLLTLWAKHGVQFLAVFFSGSFWSINTIL